MSFYDEFSKYKNIKRYEGEFGLEIETEGKHAYDIPKMSFWSAHIDDSLRGPAPYEYVLKVPLKFEKEIPQALDEFRTKTKDVKFDEDSFTTSVHTHVNMLNEKFTTFGNFIVTYTVVENLLKKFAGETRESNLFCLPFSDAEENYNNLTWILQRLNKREFMNMELDMQAAKYAAMNFCSLHKFGSLEIRLLRGTTDTRVIHDWLGILYSILQFSRQDYDPKQMISLWKNKGSELLTDIFGPYRKLLRFKDEDSLIEQNFWYAANAAMVIPDWRALDKEVKAKKLSYKNLDDLGLKIFGKPYDDLNEGEKKALFQHFKYVGDENNANLIKALQGNKLNKAINFEELAQQAVKKVKFKADPNAAPAQANPFLDAIPGPWKVQEQPEGGPIGIDDLDLDEPPNDDF